MLQAALRQDGAVDFSSSYTRSVKITMTVLCINKPVI
jgi:hypothetical protein